MWRIGARRAERGTFNSKGKLSTNHIISTDPSAYPAAYLPLYLFTYLGNLFPMGIYKNTRIYVLQEKLEKDAQRARRRNDDVGDFCILASSAFNTKSPSSPPLK